MITHSKKYFNSETQKWEPLYAVEGRSAFETAKLNGFTGTEEEFNEVLSRMPGIINSIENYPTQDSINLITSGGVYKAIDELHQEVISADEELENKINDVEDTLIDEINEINELLTNQITNVETELTNKIDKSNEILSSEIIAIRDTIIPQEIVNSIVDDLNSTLSNKSLSANQGRVLKEMISNLVHIRIEIVNPLPEIGEENVIYLVPKSNLAEVTNIYDEYIYLNAVWEKIGDTKVDLSDYYTKDQVDQIKSDVESEIPVIPDIEISLNGSGNVITSVDVDLINKHKVNVTKEFNVYTEQEIDDKFLELDNVVTSDLKFESTGKVIISDSTERSVKDSDISLDDLALKSYVDNSIPTWETLSGKPETFTPSEHSHTVNEITNFPELGNLAYKDKINESDLSFEVSNGNVVAAEDLDTNYIIISNGSNEIKSSDYTFSDVAFKNEIPTTLPNPHNLVITAGEKVIYYNGSESTEANLDNVFSKKLNEVDTPGKPGIYFGSEGSISVETIYVNKFNPEAIIFVPLSTLVTFKNYFVSENIPLSTTIEASHVIYHIRWLRSNVAIVNAIPLNYKS